MQFSESAYHHKRSMIFSHRGDTADISTVVFLQFIQAHLSNTFPTAFSYVHPSTKLLCYKDHYFALHASTSPYNPTSHFLLYSLLLIKTCSTRPQHKFSCLSHTCFLSQVLQISMSISVTTTSTSQVINYKCWYPRHLPAICNGFFCICQCWQLIIKKKMLKCFSATFLLTALPFTVFPKVPSQTSILQDIIISWMYHSRGPYCIPDLKCGAIDDVIVLIT